MIFDPTQNPQYAQNPTPLEFLQDVDGTQTQITQPVHHFSAASSGGTRFSDPKASKRQKFHEALREMELEQNGTIDNGNNDQSASKKQSTPSVLVGESKGNHTNQQSVSFNPLRDAPFQWLCLTVEKLQLWMNLDTAQRVLEGTVLGCALKDGASDEVKGVFLVENARECSTISRGRKRKQDVYMYLPDREPHIWQIIWGFFKSGEVHPPSSMNSRIVAALKQEADHFRIHSLSKVLKERAIDWREYIVLHGKSSDIRIRGMSLFSVNLEPLNLSSIDFSMCKLFKCNLKSSDLSNCTFNGAKFVDTQMDSSKAFNVSMKQIVAQNCCFDRMIFEKSLLSGIIQNSNFSKALFKQCSLDSLDLKGITFNQCGFSAVKFGTVLRNKFLGTNLEDCSFYRCTFTGTDLSFLQFPSTCTINRCVFDSCNVQEAQNSDLNVDWSSVHLKKCQFKNCKLSKVNFSEASLEQCYFSNGNLKDCNFTRASLHSFKIQDSVLQESKFSFASLQFADFSRVNFSSASFASADLTGVTFEECDLSLSDFSMSTTRGARVERCQTHGVINFEPFKGADAHFKTPKKHHHSKHFTPSPKKNGIASPRESPHQTEGDDPSKGTEGEHDTELDCTSMDMRGQRTLTQMKNRRGGSLMMKK
uniref:Uncharacterized protein n=1 Tax=Percolomonas cosmopolitus TaxID=63605 RepID=A0A7S1KNQ0_9EUKA|mmetsp:Transcript_3167/g.12125  ORF Transcript_3167/g.12125 Transcript_3167/m.12125 type:complete len:646 (+) Transcript_3167:435-2372(+)